MAIRQGPYSREFPEDLVVTEEQIEETSTRGRERGLPQVVAAKDREITEQEERLANLLNLDIDYPKLPSDIYQQALGSKGERELAIDIAYEVKKRNPEAFQKTENPYKSIAMGDASFLRGTSGDGKILSDREIIEQYLRNPDDVPMRMGSLSGGAKTGAVKGAGSLAGAASGAYLGYQLQAPIPPVGPAPIVLKFAIPVATTIAGSIAGEKGLRAIANWATGEDELVAPGKGQAYEITGETAALGASFIPMPFLAPSKVTFGASKYLNNLQRQRDEVLAKFADEPATAATLEKMEEAAAAIPKDPRSVKLVRAAENLIGETGRRARDPRLRGRAQTLAEETAFAAGATAGRYGAESELGGDYGTAAEIGGGLASALAVNRLAALPVTVTETIPAIYDKIKRKVLIAFSKNVDDLPPTLKEQMQGAEYILSQLQKEGVTPKEKQELVEKLFLTITDEQGRINLSAGQLTENAAMQKIETEVSKLFPEFGVRADRELQRVISRNLGILRLAADDPEANMNVLRLLASKTQDLLELQFNNELIDAATKAVQAFEKVGGQDPTALAANLRELLTQAQTIARGREKRIYAALPDYEISTFVGPDGEAKSLPNIFDWVSSLTVNRSSLRYEPAPVKQAVDFIKQVLEDSGIDVRQLGKRAGDGGAEAVDTSAQERLIERLDQSRQPLIDNLEPQQTAVLEELNSSSSDFNALDLDEQRQALLVDKEAIDARKQAVREGVESPVTITDLNKVRAIVANRINRVNAQIGARDIANRAGTVSTSAEDRLADEIIDLQALITELEDLGTPVVLNARQLRQARSDASSGRADLRAGANPNVKAANSLKEFIKLVDEDLFNSVDSLDSDVRGAVLAARAYSRALNQTLYNSSAGQLFTEKTMGSPKVPDETMVDTLFAQGRTGNQLRNARDIQEVGSFLNRESTMGPNLPPIEAENRAAFQLANDIDSVLQKMILAGRGVALKPRFDPTGPVTPENVLQVVEDVNSLNMNALRTWLNDDRTQQMLALFPEELTEELNNPISAYELFKTAENRIAETAEDAKNVLIFKRILAAGDETPDTLVSQIMSSKKPTDDMRDTFKQIQMLKGKEGVSGTEIRAAETALRDAFVRWAVGQGTRSGRINPGQIRAALFDPMKGSIGDVSLSDYLKEYGLFSELEIGQIQKTLDQLVGYDNVGMGRSAAELAQSGRSSMGAEFLLGAVGSRLATSLNQAIGSPAGGQSILVAGAGARLARSLLSRESRVLNVEAIMYLLQNPKKLATFLNKDPEDLKTSQGYIDMLRRFLARQGFVVARRSAVGAQGDYDEELPEPAPQEEPAPPRRQRQTPRGGGQTPADFRRQQRDINIEQFDEEELPLPVEEEPRPTEQAAGPLSVQNNNPGNLRLAGQPGAVEGEGGFAAFSTPGQGLTALTRQVVLDTQTRGLTLEDFLNKYAPPSENQTNRYIDFVERQTGLRRDQKVPEFKIPELVRAIVRMEGGQLAMDYFFGEEQKAETLPPQPPIAQAAPPMPPAPAPVSPQSLQRAAQVLGPQDEIGMLASEMLMRQGPA